MASLARIVKVANQLLNSIAVREREQILAECTTIPLPLGCVLYEANHAMRYAYFPTSGFVSLISQDGTKQGLEVSLVGAEGMVGSTLALGVRSSPLKALIQGEGSALRMRADRFAAALNESVQLRRVIGAYLFVQYAQVAQTATCGTFHGLDARLARWTLLTQDRAGVSRFRLTHELVAQMLGVRRAGVNGGADASETASHRVSPRDDRGVEPPGTRGACLPLLQAPKRSIRHACCGDRKTGLRLRAFGLLRRRG